MDNQSQTRDHAKAIANIALPPIKSLTVETKTARDYLSVQVPEFINAYNGMRYRKSIFNPLNGQSAVTGTET